MSSQYIGMKSISGHQHKQGTKYRVRDTRPWRGVSGGAG